jgi:fatty-acyl-CoA synthase
LSSRLRRPAQSGIAILLTDHAALFAGERPGGSQDRPDDIVQIQYTSGTTGFPKGALLHQKGLVQNGFDTVARWGIARRSHTDHHAALHTAGCALLVLGGLANRRDLGAGAGLRSRA